MSTVSYPERSSFHRGHQLSTYYEANHDGWRTEITCRSVTPRMRSADEAEQRAVELIDEGLL